MTGPAPDLHELIDITACPICGRDACEDHLPAPGLSEISDTASTARRLLALTLDELRTHRFPPRPTLLMRDGVPIVRAGHIGEVVAGRGIGKTWLLQSLGLAAASKATVLGFHAPSPCRVLYIDGEMAAEDLKDRFALLERLLRVGHGATVTTVAADWQDEYLPRLDTQVGQDAVEPFIAAADLIILDNRSCLFDPEGEKDPAKWQPAQDWLLSLRRRGKAVLMAHHANRQGGAGGHSKPEDPLDLIINLARPDDYSADQGSRFVVTFEKSPGRLRHNHGPLHRPPDARGLADGRHQPHEQRRHAARRVCAAGRWRRGAREDRYCRYRRGQGEQAAGPQGMGRAEGRRHPPQPSRGGIPCRIAVPLVPAGSGTL